MHRASVHSVRPVTERERFDYEMTHPESIGNWKTLADMIPQRSYIDLVSEDQKSRNWMRKNKLTCHHSLTATQLSL